jgi:hypothetical protein
MDFRGQSNIRIQVEVEPQLQRLIIANGTSDSTSGITNGSNSI